MAHKNVLKTACPNANLSSGLIAFKGETVSHNFSLSTLRVSICTALNTDRGLVVYHGYKSILYLAPLTAFKRLTTNH